MRAHYAIITAAVLAAGLLAPALAPATPLTFQIPVRDVLASVGQTNAFLVALDREARGIKVVPGGIRFAGLTCAGYGDVYQLGAVTIVAGTDRLPGLVTTKRGHDGAALKKAFDHAGLTAWEPPASTPESDLQFWTATPVPHGLRFAAAALTNGSDDGLLGPGANGTLRFRANVPAEVAVGKARFLVELVGRTSSRDAAGLVVFAERRCFTFVDAAPVDPLILDAIVDTTVDSLQLRGVSKDRLRYFHDLLARRDVDRALGVVSIFTSQLVASTPTLLPSPVARNLIDAIFRVRRGLGFAAATAECGNGVRETNEACDGGDFGGFTCASVGFASGTLGCSATCRFDTAGCVANPVCGNGVIEVGEECDNGATNSNAEPDACRTNCRRAFCGDGVIDVFEDCEGGNLDGETCKTLGYAGGSLRCDREFCEFDDERCTEENF